MGLFAKVAAAATVAPPPDMESRDYLEVQIDHWLGELRRTDIDKLERARAETQLRVYQDRLALLKFAKPPAPSQQDAAGFYKPDKNTYQSLLLRCKALNLPEEWLKQRLGAENVNLQTFENWTDTSYYSINSVLKDLEHKAAELDKKTGRRRRKTQVEKPAANDESAATSDDYEEVVKWAAGMNVARVQVAGYWGAIVAEFGWSKRAMSELKNKVSDYVKALQKPEEKKKVSLFAKTKVDQDKVVNTETGEAQPLPSSELSKQLNDEMAKRRAAGLDVIREELGLKDVEVPATKEQVERVLRIRSQLLNELSEVTKNFDQISNSLESQIKGIEEFYSARLEAYRRANPPATGKSIKTLYGSLKLQDTPRFVALDTERDPDRSLLRAWVSQQPDELKKEFEVKPREGFDFNWEKVKTWYVKQLDAKAKLAIPGVRVTDPVKDKFSISPSMSTVKENTRKELRK